MSQLSPQTAKRNVFSICCKVISVLYVMLAASILARPLAASMSQFKVPSAILRSLHYIDAMHWVYTHMLVLGLIIGLIGWFAEHRRLTLAFSRLMFVVHVYYTWLDFRASDSFVGIGIYKGPASLIPAYISLVFTFVFLFLSVRPSAHPEEPRP